jgi:peptide chain release factor 3
LSDMAEEGVAQIVRPLDGSWPILGAVGSLQLDVLLSRLKQEYEVVARLERAPYETARWVTADDPKMLERFRAENGSSLAQDNDGALVFLARNMFALNWAAKEWPDIAFLKVRERD